MRSIWSAGAVVSSAALVIALIGPVAAQSTRPQPAVANPSGGEKAVTASGCLSGDRAGYKLESLVGGKTPHEEAEAHVGTSGVALSYTLMARDGVNLAEYVGKKIEVRGTLHPIATTGSKTESEGRTVKQDDSPEAGRKPTSGTPAVELPKIAVTSVQLLSATCQ
jgi:hypothetical protein